MNFKLFLEENDIRVIQLNDDGSKITIAYPDGVYEYETYYGAKILGLVKKFRYTPGKLANEVKGPCC